ncbi:unnamed protein product [Cunninghamella echinulata]
MGGIYFTFQEQKAHEANLDLKAMGIQIGINLGISILVVTGFCILRPKHNLVYAPKYKYLSENKKPPKIGNEYFGWVKVLFRAKDDFLLERLGYDAILFLKFLRLLRRILLIMSIIGVFALIPMNIVATRYTGQYEVGIDVLTISGINYLNGKLSETSDLRWYWSPFTATWLFTLIIMYFIHSFSNEYIKLRQRYFREEGNEAAKTVLLSNLPHDIRSDQKLKAWVELLGIIKHKITDSLIGVANTKLTSLYEEHELAVEHLEIALASYLNAKNRPTMRVGGFLGIGGKKVDVIEHYTKLVSDLDAKIKELRHSTKKAGNYGWISFQQIEQAQEAETIINKYVHLNGKKHEPHLTVDARPSPLSRDLIWANLSLDKTKRQVKRWSGRLIYWIFTCLWMIPIGAFAATSNLINLLHFIPNSDVFIEDHAVLMGLIESYFTPIIMSLFFLLLPAFFRFICQQQAYRTHTTLDRKVFLKLYVFFIINNFLVFTLVNIFIGIFGQIHAIVTSGTLTDDNVGSYVVQLAKNISDVSTFWVNYVCMKGLGLTMELCQVLPLMLLTIRKWISRPSPRQLREYARPPPFDYPQGYSLLVFFFTIALLYSAMAPLVLPFALMYFSIASLVYKYMLIGYIQSYCLIPLPFITLAFQWFYSRRLSDAHCYNVQVNINWMEHQPTKPTPATNQSGKKQDKLHTLKNQFRDPAIYHKLSNPIVHDDVKHLLPTVYKNVTHPKEAFEMLNVHKASLVNKNKKNTTSTARDENYMDRRNSSMIKMDLDEGLAIKFSTMTENDAIETAMEDYIYDNEEEEEEQSDDTISTYSNNDNSNVQQQQNQEQSHLIPTMQLQNITDFNHSDDEFDEKRGLLQDHGEWQQQQQQQDHTSLYSSTSYPFSSMNEKVDHITDQEVFDWKLERKGVTSEFVEIYETLPAQSTTDLSCLTLQQELEQQKRNDNYMKKRKSAPYIQFNSSNNNNNKEGNNHPTSPGSLPLHRSQSMVYVKKKKNKEEEITNTNEDDDDIHSDEKQRRRLSQPFFVQYGQQHQAAPSELILENRDNHDNRDGNYDRTLRRQSIHMSDHVELEHDRRGSWIHQFDQWWPHRYDHHQQQHQRLGRSHTIMAGPAQQSNNNTNNRVLRRAHTLHDNNNNNNNNNSSSSSNNNQQNDNQIFRITYYDDLLDNQ